MYFSLEYAWILEVGLLLFCLWQIILGYSKGLLDRVLSLVATLAALFLALTLAKPLAQAFPLFTFFAPQSWGQALNGPLQVGVWFLLVFVVIRLVFWLMRMLFNGLTQLPIIKQLNTLGGVVFGMLCSAIVIALTSVLLVSPLFQNGYQVIEQTWLRYTHPYVEEALQAYSIDLKSLKNLQMVFMQEADAFTQEQVIKMLQEWKLSDAQIQAFLQSKGS
ncbi:MAG: CvpA family protein [Erysipelotrichaceae bacterium]